jgi:hypothetical protein
VGGGQRDGYEEYALMPVGYVEMYSSCCHYILYAICSCGSSIVSSLCRCISLFRKSCCYL